MKLLLQILITLYELGILPLAIGSIITFLWKKTINPFSYLLGYLIMMGVFLVLAVPMICLRLSLADIILVWKVFSAGMAVVLFVFLVCNFPALWKWATELVQRLKSWEVERSLIIVICLVIMLGAVVWVMPSQEDDTAEIAAITVETGTIYEYQPYTMEKYSSFPNEKVFSPIEIFYVVNADISGIQITEFIHMLLPLFMIPVVFAVYWHVGEYFWPGQERKKEMFVAFIAVFYSIAVCSVKSLMVGVIQNVWNGTSFAAGCIFPLVMIESFWLLDKVEQRKKGKLPHVLMLLLCILTGQLLLSDAYMVSGVVILCSIVGKMTKRWLIRERSN
jgi:hypothetical protein